MSRDPPLSDQGETIIGVYLLVLGWLSWFGNSIVIFVLFKHRSSLQPTDYLTLNLAISDASISVFGYSRGILEIFNIFRDNGYLITSVWTCQVDGFFTLVFGLGSINTLTVISISRYIKGCHPNKAHCITNTTVLMSVIFIWTGALFWSGAPILGWGSYTDRGYGTCEIDWVKANYSTIHKSFIISILIFCFFIPVLIMLFSYISIINTVKRGNARSAERDLTDRQRKIERDVTVVSHRAFIRKPPKNRQLHKNQKKHPPANPAPGPAPGVCSHLETPPPAGTQVFFIDAPEPPDTPESQCVRL
uniref:Opsin 6, group member a n=1 Tax=Cyprinus carpio TaxID=7962 RepID=A0A8C2IR13_CYPCA